MHPHGNEQVGASLFPQVALYIRKGFGRKHKLNNRLISFVITHDNGARGFMVAL
jgi:hypothetical protein